MTEGAQRPALLLAPGAQYLFWTTGVFYVFELAEDYDLILLVSEDYRQSEAFIRLTEQLPNLRVYYIPHLRPVRRLHRFYATEARRIVAQFRPRFILSNDIWGMEMLYLFHFGRLLQLEGHPCTRIAIQTSNWFRDFEKDLDLGRDQHAFYYVREYRVPRVLALGLVSVLMHTFRVLNVFFYPALYAGKPLRPWRTLAPPVSSQRDSQDKFDWFVYYTDAEGVVMRPRFSESCRFQKVVHPLPAHEDEARRLMKAHAEEPSILVLPSYVSVRLLQTDLGLSEPEAIELLSNRWVEIVTHLCRRFPSVPVRWKVHPQSARDPHWRAVTERVCSLIPSMEVLDASEKAEKLIFEHRVIVGDISTALMWAALLPSKIVISFDVFGKKYLEMSGRERIWYVDDVSALGLASFDTSQPGEDASRTDQQVPTIRGFLAQLIAGAHVARDHA